MAGKYSDFARAIMEEVSEAGKGAAGFWGQDVTSVRDLEMARIQAEAEARLEQAETDRLNNAYNAGGTSQRIPNTTTGPRIQRLPTPYDQPTLERARTRAGAGGTSTGGILLFASLFGVAALAAARAK